MITDEEIDKLVYWRLGVVEAHLQAKIRDIVREAILINAKQPSPPIGD